MAVKLRLMRMGKKKQPTYRIVASDTRSPRDGRFIEIIGTYEPRKDPSAIQVDSQKAVGWLMKGAKASDTVRKLLEHSGTWAEFKQQRPDKPAKPGRKRKAEPKKKAAKAAKKAPAKAAKKATKKAVAVKKSAAPAAAPEQAVAAQPEKEEPTAEASAATPEDADESTATVEPDVAEETREKRESAQVAPDNGATADEAAAEQS